MSSTNIGNYWVLSLLWSMFFVLHSILASAYVKDKLIPHYLKQVDYRKIYNIISLVSLTIIVTFMRKTKFIHLPIPDYFVFVGYFLLLLGMIIGFFAFISFGVRPFLGLSSEYKSDQLIIDGLYKYVRHPLYTALISIFIGLLLIIRTDMWLLSTLCVFVYLPIGIYFEEKKLLQEYPEYSTYRNRVKSVIPFII